MAEERASLYRVVFTTAAATTGVVVLTMMMIFFFSSRQTGAPTLTEENTGAITVGDIETSFRNETAPARIASAPRRASTPRSSPTTQPRIEQPAVRAADPPAPVVRTSTIPAGTRLEVVLDRRLSTETNHSGDSFPVTLVRAVVIEGETILPESTRMVGEITALERPGRASGVAKMTLFLKGISNGEGEVPIQTNSLALEGKTTKTEDAAKVGIGTAIGVAFGAIFGGGKGAVKGGTIGAGGGVGTVLATRGEELVLAPEQRLLFVLTRNATFER